MKHTNRQLKLYRKMILDMKASRDGEICTINTQGLIKPGTTPSPGPRYSQSVSNALSKSKNSIQSTGYSQLFSWTRSNKLKILEKSLSILMKCTTVSAILIEALKEIERVIHCKSVVFFIFDEELQQTIMSENSASLMPFIHRTNLNDIRYDCICLETNSQKVEEPLFNSIESIRNGIITQIKLVNPLINLFDKIIGCFQIVNKQKVSQMQEENLDTSADMLILKIITYMTQSLLIKIIHHLRADLYSRDMVNTVKFCSKISSTRSLKELITKLTYLLPEFLGFKSMGILIQDKISNDMFTIPIFKDDKTGNAITQIIKFPPEMGISGSVFKNEEVYVSNDASQERKFSNDIDNLSSLQDLYNFMIFPINSYIKGMKRKVGVVQLLTKFFKN